MKRQPYLFHWRTGNHFELLIDGRAFLPRMLDAIEQARHYVLLEMYWVESSRIATRFISALSAAAERDVTVKLLLDGFGSRNLDPEDRDRLRAAGVDLHFHNPVRLRKLIKNLFRDHRKLLLVDGALAFVSGTGLADQFDTGSDPVRGWRENAVAVRGPVLADWIELFRLEWQRHARSALTLPQVEPAAAAGSMPGRVSVNSAAFPRDIQRSLLQHISSARSRVWLATSYFVPRRTVLRALERAARRGVDVRLLLPGPIIDHPTVRHASHRFYTRLLRNKVRILEYQPRFLHCKTVLCDDWVSIGSSNHDRWNLHWNLEANQEIGDPGFAQRIGAMFEDDSRASAEIDYETWRRRPWLVRLREFCLGYLDLWLDRLGRLRGLRRSGNGESSQ